MAGTGEAEMARYIASMCQQLAQLAEQSGFDTGAYLLRMASLEFTTFLEFTKQADHIRPDEMAP